MKARCILSGAAALGMLILTHAARGQVLFPTSGNVTAGDTISFIITGLNTNADPLPPTKIYIYSEDPERLAAPTEPIEQPLVYDESNSNFVYQSYLTGVDGVTLAARKQVDGLFSPIRVHFIAVMYGIIWSDTAEITVDHPTLSFQPAAPALRVGETVPLVVRRTIDANATLNFQLESGAPSVLGVGTNAAGLKTNASVNVQFSTFEVSKTLYISGLAAIQGDASTNVELTARVGSYATNISALVSTNAGLLLAPASPTVAAGDTLIMTVTRGSPTNVSALTVYPVSDNPAVLQTPASVTIPAGAQSVNFPVYALKPGAAIVSVTAIGVEPSADSSRQVFVSNPALIFDPDPASVPVGALRVITIRRPAVEAGGSLVVTLANNSPSLFTLSADTVTIPAGYVSAVFSVLGVSAGSGSLSAQVGAYQPLLSVEVTSPEDENDPDGDGLSTEWELILGSDPYDAYSLDPADILNDGEWDSDGDGLSNYEEIVTYATDPLRPDTDDDGVNDRTEVREDITSPLHPMSSRLYRERSLDLAAVPAAGFDLPDSSRLYVRTNGWTVECWLRPDTDGDGQVFSLVGAGASQSFWAGLEDFRPKVQILSGTNVMATAGGVGASGSIQQLPSNEWTHVAWAWGPQDNSLKIFVNGVLLIAQETLAAPDFFAGTGVLARALADGYLDDVRFWNYDRSWEEIDFWHNRIYPAPAGFVRTPIYGQTLALYYRFDDGGSNTVDFAHLNDPDYFIPGTVAMMSTNEAVSLLAYDDEDGDLLPEWWVKVHNLDQYPEFEYGPNFEYFDSTARFLARVTYFRTFRAYTSIGNTVGWAQDADNLYHEPKDQGLGHDGRYSAFTKYVYLYSVPKTATLDIFTPGMESTLAYVNGELLTATNDAADAQQSLDVAGHLKIGRNMIFVRCISQYDTWLDEARTVPVIIPPTANHFERTIGKFDARLTVDGVQLIVRGDTSLNDPRAVWFAQTWSTFWQMMFGYGEMPTRPDKENRYLPGNPDYGLPFDADTDAYNAWYEFLSGTNPRDDDSNNNGIPDGLEDFDGDGLVNRGEQERGTHPLLPDTDDDDWVDGVEVAEGEDPANAQSPAVSRALAFPGGPDDFVEMPMQRRFALDSWTIETWVRLNAGEGDGGILVQRAVGPTGMNYELGLGDGVTAPTNVPYVRYVSVNGFSVQANGTTALTTNWTHVAGTYDGYQRELKLYVGGAYTSTAPQALESPAIYAGGPVVQRMGAGLDGAMDDIRLWSVPRTEIEIQNSISNALQGSEANLVAYYRADDSSSYRTNPLVGTSANNGTNGTLSLLPWTWGQVQDYGRAYSGDWWEKWSHAATFRGLAAFTTNDDGAIPIPPSLRVTLLPPEAVDDGAQWAVQGVGSWHNSGVSVYEDLPPGTNTILFKSVYGWTAPSNRTVVLSNNVTTVLTETYIRNGALRVEIAFVDLDTHGELWPVTGAQWRVTGGVWKNSGETMANLTPGNYVVEFKAIPGWDQPAPAAAVVLPGETALVLRQYIPATAALRVLIEPTVAITMGALWRLDAGPWTNSGVTLYDVGLGAHLITFNEVSPWVTPGAISLDLTSTNLITVTGRYEQVTGLYVQIAPPEAVAAGAQWRVTGGSWYNSEELVAMPAGSYTVEFKPLTGWGQAPDVQTAVTSGYTTVISATYNPQDPDNDGVSSDWETILGSDPYDPYSLDPADVLNDGEWDSDGDDLSNYEEISIYSTDPLRKDTDDDGVEDGEEIRTDLSHPLHPMSSRLYRERSLDLGASPAAGFILPDPSRFLVRTNGWTVEAWLYPGTDGDGEVFRLEGGTGGQRFWVGLEDHRPKVELLSGASVIAVAGGVGPEGSIQRLPTNEWTHVAWAWGPQDNSLKIFVNGVLLIAQETLVAPDFSNGTGILARAFSDGYLDDIRVWNYDRSWDEIDYWNNRFVPAPSGYVRMPAYGQPLALYYRFDDGGSNTVDFAHLNDPDYFIPDTPSFIVTNPAVSLLGRDDEDGDQLPEWWTSLHGLDMFFRTTNFGPFLLYFDESSDPQNVARVAFYRAAHVYASVGGYWTWLDQTDHMWYSPKDSLLGWDGRYSTYLKYLYLYKAPQTAILKIHTPGMVKTIAYVNGERITSEENEVLNEQSLEIAPHLRTGRNAVYIYCESSFNMYLDEERIELTTDPKDQAWWEGIKGKFDAELECDGQPVIVRGDHSRNDPRAVWFAQAWSTYIDLMDDPPWPDLEMRALPGNADYGLPFDTDTDDFNAWYEYLSGTNPRDDDSNNNGIPDGLEDFDGDGLVNRSEQERGAHPLLPDTDDDSRVDGVESASATDPADAQSPAISRALTFAGGADDFAEMPMQRRFAMNHWTLEAWVRLAAGESDGGILIQRAVGPNGVNYELGLGDGVSAAVNVPYVRYVSVSGLVVQATGSVALATGSNWTHVAGAYDGYQRELKLYVNGVFAGEAPEALQPPAIYAGGPVIQRLGTGLNGALDDIRLWSVARTEQDIAAVYFQSLQGNESNLVAYYRADDSSSYRTNPLVGTSANNGTNGAVSITPWTWGQVQDYVRGYSGDWWDKWDHAASFRGIAQFTADHDGALFIPPSLRVTLLPPAAVSDGAQWAIQGIGAWRDSGVTVYDDLPEGTNTVLFKSIYGWTAPSNRTVVLSNGVTTVLTETYVLNGALRVEFSFVDEATHGLAWPVDGAQWRIGSGAWRTNGETVHNLTPGNYIVQFKDIDGWLTPANLPATVLSGATTLLLGQYMPASAALQVFIEPPDAVAMGARWRLDAGSWYQSGYNLGGIPLGDHTVSFTNLPSWITPASIIVELVNTNLVVVTGRYTEVTGIYVQIIPPDAIASGAQWRVVGGDWTNSDVTLEVAAGPYTVEFKSVPFWGQAPNIETTVTNGKITRLIGNYLSMEIYGPPGETNAVLTLLLNEPRGLAFDALRRLHIADSKNNRIVILDTRDLTVTTLGTYGTSPGQFNQPFGVALDRGTNLYVADTGNHRVQRRTPAGAWTAWGSYGAAVGQFNTPYDVAVDAFTNLYVTDRDNHRVQKRTPANAWYVFVSNGFDDAYVRVVKGVTVDYSNRVVVSDHQYPTREYSRIQIFNTNGAFLGRIGSSTNTEGSLFRPQRMSFGTNNQLYVADMNNSRVVRRRDPGEWDILLDGNVLDHPEGVAWDARGYVYIADTAHNRVVRIQVYQSTNIPPVFSQTLPGPGGVTISWTGASGWFYTIQYTDNILDPNSWTNLVDCAGQPGVEAVMGCTDTNNTGIPGRTYRVMAY